MLVAMGDNCLDVYVGWNQVFLGGNALNVAVDWRSAGHDAHYFGTVGDDPAAQLVLDELSRQGLPPEEVEWNEGLTGVTLIELVDQDRRFLFEEFGAGATWTPGPAAWDAALRADWVHVAGMDLSCGIAEQLVRAGARVSVDLSTFGTTAGFAGCAVAFASAPEDPSVAWERAEEIIGAGAQSAIVTAGSLGAVAIDASGPHEVDAVETTVVDTCGAGDSFIAEATASLAAGGDMPAALASAARQAARTCAHHAGFPQQGMATIDWIREHYLRPRGLLPAEP